MCVYILAASSITSHRIIDTYSVRLPSALPPTYRGRTFKFSYNLVVGTCRGRAAGADSQSRLLRIPLRVYNHVSGVKFHWYFA